MSSRQPKSGPTTPTGVDFETRRRALATHARRQPARSTKPGSCPISPSSAGARVATGCTLPDMRWSRWRLLALGMALMACASAPPRATTWAPRRATTPATVATSWPDVTREARAEKTGMLDGAVVVAVEGLAGPSHASGARITGQDWARFFPTVLGVPANRVTALFDRAATRPAILSAVQDVMTRLAPGGRLWFVAIGHVVAGEAEVANLATPRRDVQLVSVLDIAPEEWASAGPAAEVLAPITLSTARSVKLDAARSAFSYFLMGALRGWGDRDRDGRVTAAEAAEYVDLALRRLAPPGASPPNARANTEFACDELTTLSVAREPVPTTIGVEASTSQALTPDAAQRACWNTRSLYARAAEEPDGDLKRCRWSEAARANAASWWHGAPGPSQIEFALNGADAYLRLDRADSAVELLRSYLERQADPDWRDVDTVSRRAYPFFACQLYLGIARREPRYFPGYFGTCRSVDCAGLEPSMCSDLTTSAAASLAVSSPSEERARQLSLLARDREELAGWETTDAARVSRWLEAGERYQAAEGAWSAIVDQRGTPSELAEAQRRLAEAAVRHLIVDLAAGAELLDERVTLAQRLARRARDLSSDDRRAEPAKLLVELADALLAREFRLFSDSHGERGIPQREAFRLAGEGDARHVVAEEIPAPVLASVRSRDEYLETVPATLDTSEARYRMAYESGRFWFLYGHFAEARERLELPFTMKCGLQRVSHDAWVLLIAMANLEGDVARSQLLASDASLCATDVETQIQADRIRKPVRSMLVLEGWRVLSDSESLADGPERRERRRRAAAIFRQFVTEAPDRDEAPEAARVAAELYAELGADLLACEMYRLFLDRYGTHARVSGLELERAYAALAGLYAHIGDYRTQARLLGEESKRTQLPSKVRAAAARKARELRADRGGRDAAASNARKFFHLGL